MKVEMNTSSRDCTLVNELQTIIQVIGQLIDKGAQVREIRVHGRARPAIVLNRPPQLAGNAYAWGKDQCGRRYERRACTLDGIQIQWEACPAQAYTSNILPFPLKATADKINRPWLSSA